MISRSTSVKSVAVIATVVIALSACAKESNDNPLVATGPQPHGGGGGDRGDGPKTPDGLDNIVHSAISDVEKFWKDEYPKVFDGQSFRPIKGYFGYGPDTEMPPCGNPRPHYDEIQKNAFYCPEGDIIAADEVNLLPDIAREFSPFTIGIVFAHEYGHAIQNRANLQSNRSVVIEMQADCFAGAWTKWVADGNSDNFAVQENQLDLSIAGMATISDQAGTSPNDTAAHGSAFDRVGSFQDGFEKGAARCTEYDTDPDLPIVESEFTDQSEFETGGNLHPFDEGTDKGLLTLAKEDLNDFYGQLFKEKLNGTWAPVKDLVVPNGQSITCDGQTLSANEVANDSGYCKDENVVVVGKSVVSELNDIGDFALAAEVARLWADAAQLQLKVDATPKNTSLQADCLTGFWAYSRFPVDEHGNQRDLKYLSLSPGDLDEGILGFIKSGSGAENVGTVFERVDALRSGFINGIDGCTRIAPLGQG